jgi:DNA-binding transcriptional regulator GbsR (MarR family)
MKKTPLEFLTNAPEEVNPALSMCRKIQRLELSGELDSATMKEMANAIELAISKGTDDVKAVEQTKEQLLNSRSVAAAIPTGF